MEGETVSIAAYFSISLVHSLSRRLIPGDAALFNKCVHFFMDIFANPDIIGKCSV